MRRLNAAYGLDTAVSALGKFGVSRVRDLPADKVQNWITYCDQLIAANS